MPTKEELEVLDSFNETAAADEAPVLALVDMEFFPDDRTSFYPLAEMYLWHRMDEIPAGKRTLDRYLPENRKRIVIGMEYIEDLSDLKKALMQKLSPSNVYAPCPCGSGLKYKFCCANKLKNFDLEQFIGS